MNVEPVWKLALAVSAGAAVSVFYFGGLWLTVRRLPTAKRPHLLMVGSFAARTVVTVAVIALLARLDWQLLAACMVGFIATRIVTVRAWGLRGAKPKDGAEAETPAQQRSEV